MFFNLKITDLKVTPVAVPRGQIYSRYSGGRPGSNTLTAVIIEVSTDEGITGIGESPNPVGAEVTKNLIESTMPMLVGENPLNVEQVKKKLYAYYNLTHLHIHAANWALNGIDIALWDILGKVCKQPLYRLWGGAFRKKIPYYGSVPSSGTLRENRKDGLKRIAEQSEQHIKNGFTTIYAKIGFNPIDDIECVKTMREAAGYGEINVRVDANQAWSPGEAIRIISKMSKYDLEFVDQPVLMYNLDNLARVRGAVDVPIASHESSWTLYEALNVIKREVADVIHVDPRFDAGYMGAKITAGIAEASGLPVVLHTFGELGVSQAAHMHLIASCPNFLYANQNGYDSTIDDIIDGGKMQFKNGCLDLPEKPGIGVELDREKMEIYNKNYEENVKGKEFLRIQKAPQYSLMGYRRFFGY